MTNKEQSNMQSASTGIIADAGGLSFGDYSATEKIKINDFEHLGNLYSLRAHDQVTRLEKNGELLLEAVPGVAVCNFALNEMGCSFEIESTGGVQVTLGLAAEVTYDLAIGDVKGAETHEEITTNRSGKLSFGVELAGLAKKVILTRL